MLPGALVAAVAWIRVLLRDEGQSRARKRLQVEDKGGGDTVYLRIWLQA